MRRLFCLLVSLSFLLSAFGTAEEERRTGIVCKVTTEKGSLKLREKGNTKGRVLAEIPNGTCLLALEEGEDWTLVSYDEMTGYCMSSFLTFLREADPAMLDYRVLRKGDKGDDVLALKKRLQELGYIRSSSDLTNVYNDVLVERITLFQRQTGMSETGVASQEIQAYLYSDAAPVCTQELPRVRSRVTSGDNANRIICGCCFGEGCECCDFTGWIYY